MLDQGILERRAEKAREACGLTRAELLMLQRCAHTVYEYVASDLAPDFKSRPTCKRSTVMEVVCDAGRLEQEVREELKRKDKVFLGTDGADHPLSKACHSYRALLDLIGPAFPYKEYEVGNG